MMCEEKELMFAIGVTRWRLGRMYTFEAIFAFPVT